MFVALSSFDEGTPGKPGHIFRTTDARSAAPTWTNVSPPDHLPFNVIVIDPRDSNSIYAGGDIGLWYSPDRGAGWQRWGLPTVGVYDLRINPTTNVVVAFTRKNCLGARLCCGVWSRRSTSATRVTTPAVPG